MFSRSKSQNNRSNQNYSQTNQANTGNVTCRYNSPCPIKHIVVTSEKKQYNKYKEKYTHIMNVKELLFKEKRVT